MPKSNFVLRTLSTVFLLVLFVVIIRLGHIAILIFIGFLSVLMYREVIAIAQAALRKHDIHTRALSWYFLFFTIFYFYGEKILRVANYLNAYDYKIHSFVAFSLYVTGIILFMASLRRRYIRMQFTHFAITHCTLLFIGIMLHSCMANVLNGLVWFIAPACLVITNDVFAYVTGKLFGRTKLTKLSPKKTLEGFVGAFIITLLCAVFLSRTLNRPWLTAPYIGETKNFTNLEFVIPFVSSKLVINTFTIHMLVLATFASLIAPLGGLFASAFKRAFKVKDFAESIPGHGGVTDRMDCQLLMCVFTYYYTRIALARKKSAEELYVYVVKQLDVEGIKKLSKMMVDHVNGSV